MVKSKQKEITKGNFVLKKEGPFYPSLETHKVQTRFLGERWSSSVSGDVRIIWDFSNDRILILLLDIGRHNGKKKVYK